MIDPVLERNTADCHQLMDQWRIFHEYVTDAVKGENISPDREESFLQVKSKIAMLHDSFMAVLEADKRIGASVLTIVSRAITLQHLARLSVAEVKKMEIEWHEAFLLLQEMLGTLEDKRAQMADISETSYRTDQARKAMRNRFNTILGSNTFKGTAVFLAVLFATVGVQVTGLFDWSSLRNLPATRAVFYAVYDKGLRLMFGEIPYYRLDWVVFPDLKDSRAYLGELGVEGFWFIEAPNAISDSWVRDYSFNDLIRDMPLPESTEQEILAAEETKNFWFYNDRFYVVITVAMMDGAGQAADLAQEIRDSIQGDFTWEPLVGTNTRSNLLLIVIRRGSASQQNANAIENFIQAAPNLIE
jgi:hypothetical protein